MSTVTLIVCKPYRFLFIVKIVIIIVVFSVHFHLKINVMTRMSRNICSRGFGSESSFEISPKYKSLCHREGDRERAINIVHQGKIQ